MQTGVSHGNWYGALSTTADALTKKLDGIPDKKADVPPSPEHSALYWAMYVILGVAFLALARAIFFKRQRVLQDTAENDEGGRSYRSASLRKEMRLEKNTHPHVSHPLRKIPL
jgi:hypothetical protein